MLKKVTIVKFVVVYDDEFIDQEEALTKEIDENGIDTRYTSYDVEDVTSIDDVPTEWRDCIPWGDPDNDMTCRDRLKK